MNGLVECVRLADKLEQIIRSAKFIYGDRWPAKKAECLTVIDAFKEKHKKESRLSAAIEMCKTIEDGRLVLVVMAAAADDKEE